MERRLEPELMDDWARAEAYALSDFSKPHDAYVERFRETFPDFSESPWVTQVVDLGCGSADPDIRFARAYPKTFIYAIDGSYPMLYFGRQAVRKTNELMIPKRIRFKKAKLPDHGFESPFFHAVISNSLLHHLPDPQVLWISVKGLALPNAPIFVMDLYRQKNEEEARRLVELHSEPDDSELMKDDFFNSFCAAFEPREVEDQLKVAGLSQLTVEVVSDRHMLISGRA